VLATTREVLHLSCERVFSVPPLGLPDPKHLETVREYALERLEADGEQKEARHGHAVYYLALAKDARPELTGPGHNAPALLLASFTRVCEEGINATHGHDGKEAYVPLNEPSGGTVAYIP
jgi:hypothetical protein